MWTAFVLLPGCILRDSIYHPQLLLAPLRAAGVVGIWFKSFLLLNTREGFSASPGEFLAGVGIYSSFSLLIVGITLAVRKLRSKRKRNAPPPA